MTRHHFLQTTAAAHANPPGMAKRDGWRFTLPQLNKAGAAEPSLALRNRRIHGDNVDDEILCDVVQRKLGALRAPSERRSRRPRLKSSFSVA